MPDPVIKAQPIAPRGLQSRTETGSIDLPAHALSQADAVTVKSGVLTVKNQQLADLIHSKLADASKLVPQGRAASDVDVGVSVKAKS
jgi:hypothetical protein